MFHLQPCIICIMSDGSEFQVCGSATENARRANSVRVLAADSSRASEDMRHLTYLLTYLLVGGCGFPAVVAGTARLFWHVAVGDVFVLLLNRATDADLGTAAGAAQAVSRDRARRPGGLQVRVTYAGGNRAYRAVAAAAAAPLIFRNRCFLVLLARVLRGPRGR